MATNDNDPNARVQMLRLTEANGQAALLLVESLIHGLIARSVLTSADSLAIVTAAVNVQADYADEAGNEHAEPQRAITLLTRIARSLGADAHLSYGSPGLTRKPTLVDTHPFGDYVACKLTPDCRREPRPSRQAHRPTRSPHLPVCP